MSGICFSRRHSGLQLLLDVLSPKWLPGLEKDRVPRKMYLVQLPVVHPSRSLCSDRMVLGGYPGPLADRVVLPLNLTLHSPAPMEWALCRVLLGPPPDRTGHLRAAVVPGLLGGDRGVFRPRSAFHSPPPSRRVLCMGHTGPLDRVGLLLGVVHPGPLRVDRVVLSCLLLVPPGVLGPA
jgi:hypothetical protein